MKRRKFITTVGLSSSCFSAGKIIRANKMTRLNDFTEKGTEMEFPALPYSYDALEPYIDKNDNGDSL
ncbi:MAG: hypothetical protein R2744_11350 [Bacteroidales bacterium]